jgi:fluoride exporter
VSGVLVWAGIAVLGAGGALSRFFLDGAVSRRVGRSFPYGTLAVNATGAFVLGVLVGATLSGDAYRLAGIGFLGAYTTFSTWMFESHRLAEDGETAGALLNVGASLAIGVVVALVGRRVGASL